MFRMLLMSVAAVRLTSRAQARGTKRREPRSGTEDAIPRCLQRFVRQHLLVSEFHLENIWLLVLKGKPSKECNTRYYPSRIRTGNSAWNRACENLTNDAI